MSERMFTYCIDELRFKSSDFRKTGIISVYDGDVVKSDNTIPPSLRNELLSAVAPLEQIPENHRDWHPGSNETVLDLVHPSLFPVVFGRTRILPDDIVGLDNCIKRSGKGETLDVPPYEETHSIGRKSIWDAISIMDKPYSENFQWLPCDVQLDNDKAK
jgi:hypothetical protein